MQQGQLNKINFNYQIELTLLMMNKKTEELQMTVDSDVEIGSLKKQFEKQCQVSYNAQNWTFGDAQLSN